MLYLIDTLHLSVQCVKDFLDLQTDFDNNGVYMNICRLLQQLLLDLLVFNKEGLRLLLSRRKGVGGKQILIKYILFFFALHIF